MSLHTWSVGSGPELFLLHGWGMNGAVWEPLVEALAGRYRLTLAELPGHGGSPLDGAGAELDGWTRACLAAAPATATWIGWSLGGALALNAARLAPERVRALVLLTATPRFARAADWPHAMPPQTLGQFHAALRNDPAGTLDRFLALQVRGDEAARTLLRDLRERLRRRPAPDGRALDHGLDLLADTDLRAGLATIAAPMLWVYGDRDTLTPARAAQAVRALAPGARTEVVAGAAHAPFLSHPDATLTLLEAFLENPHAG